MNDTPTATTPFWRFSLKFYGQSGVSDACIALQDGCGDRRQSVAVFVLAGVGAAGALGGRSRKSSMPRSKAGASSPSFRSAIRAASSKAPRPSSIRPSRKRCATRSRRSSSRRRSCSRKRSTPSPSPDRSASRPSLRPRRAAMSRLSSARWAQAFPRRPSTFWLTPSTA